MKKTILIIDDDENFSQLLGYLLKNNGYDVVTAPDGAQGIRILAQENIDLVVCDILMPVKEGFETIMEIKSTFGNAMPVIAISGQRAHTGGEVVPDILTLSETLGANSSLAKPIRKDELLAAIEKLLRETPTP